MSSDIEELVVESRFLEEITEFVERELFEAIKRHKMTPTITNPPHIKKQDAFRYEDILCKLGFIEKGYHSHTGQLFWLTEKGKEYGETVYSERIAAPLP